MRTVFRRRLLPILILAHLFTPCVLAHAQRGDADKPESCRTKGCMTLGQALILGIVEGLTEYLPVSSTGHILLAQKIMGIGVRSSKGGSQSSIKEASDAYAVSIQGGAIMAVVFLYRRRILAMVLGALGRDPAGLRLATALFVSFLPAALFGLLLERTVKLYLFGPWPIVVAWFGGGVAIFLVARQAGNAKKERSIEKIGIKGAVVIGLFQCLALWPGVSRSLAAIVGGLIVGLSMKEAVEFSFLLGLVTLGAASIFDLMNHWSVMLEFLEPTPMAMGFLCSMVSAAFAIKWMIGYLEGHGLEVFGYYRIGIALATSALLLLEIL